MIFEHIPTGSSGLDYLIGGDDPKRCPGFPIGMITHIIGPYPILATIESAVLNRHPDVAIRPMWPIQDAPGAIQDIQNGITKGTPLILVRDPPEDKTLWAVALPAILDQISKARMAVVILSNDKDQPPISLKFYAHVKIVIDESRLATVHKNKLAPTQGTSIRLTRSLTPKPS